MTVIISGDTGIDTVGSNTVGNGQLIDGSVQHAKLGFTLPFTKEYESPEQVITLGATINLSNTLGVMPKLVQISLICKTAEIGAVIGEEVSVARDANNGSWGVDIFRTSANLRLVVGGHGVYIIKDNGLVTPITPANWRLIVRAWA